jgi:hypothetical protein
MTPLQNLTIEQLRKAVSIKEQIETLQEEIEAISNDWAIVPVQRRGRGKMSNLERARKAAAARWAKAKTGDKEAAPTERRKFSAAHRAALVAAQRARWAKVKAGKVDEAEPKKKRKISAAGRAKIAAAAKARWAKFRAAGKKGR